MRLLRNYPLMCFLLVMLSIVGVCVAQQSVGLFLVAGALGTMSWFITEGPRGRTLPGWVTNLLVIAVCLNVAVDAINNPGDWAGVLGRFAVWLTVVKLYERRTTRDHAQLLILSLLMMVTASLRSSELLFGLILLAYAGFGLYVLMLHQLYATYQANKAAREAATPDDYRLAPPLKPVIGRSMRWHFRVLVSGVALLGLVLSTVVFVLFPRDVGYNMLSIQPTQRDVSETGFVDRIDLRSGTRINNSPRVAMRVTIRDESGLPYRYDGPLLLRGAVLEVYEGDGRWREMPRGPRPVHSYRVQPDVVYMLAPLPRELPTQTLEVDLIQRRKRLFAPLVPTAIELERSAEVRYELVTQLLSIDGRARRHNYVVHFADIDNAEVQSSLVSRRFSRRGRFLRDLQSPAIRSLGHEILQRAGIEPEPPSRRGDPEASYEWNQRVAEAFRDYLRSGQFTYTLDLSGVVIEEGTADFDPIERFLLSTRRGHCEYFASALVSLCFNVGVEARIVNGYAATEYDPELQQYMVRESDAHSWAEVLTGARKWTTVDPTPPLVLQSRTVNGNGLGGRWRSFAERLDGTWSSAIVGFDGETQSQLGHTVDLQWSARLTRAFDRTRQWMQDFNRAFYLGPAGYIWMATMSLPLIVAVIALIKLMRRSLRIRRTLHLQHLKGAEYQRMLRQLGFYLDMLDVLHRSGHSKPGWQPPAAFADDLARAEPTASELVRSITDLFYRARYGSQQLDREQRQHARAMTRQLAEQLNVRASSL